MPRDPMDDFDFPPFPPFPVGNDGVYWQEPDFLLSNLVSLMANKMNAEMGITLLVKGTIMTGSLVGEREYLHAVNEMFKAVARDTLPAPTKADLKAIDEAFTFDQLTEDNYLEDHDDDFDDEDDEDDFDLAQIRHLHLKDPVIIFPNTALSFTESPLPIMRLRLSMVDGWMIGRMNLIAGDDMGEELDLPGIPTLPPRRKPIKH